MKIIRCDLASSSNTSPSKWPVLADVPLKWDGEVESYSEGNHFAWDGYRDYSPAEDQGFVDIRVTGILPEPSTSKKPHTKKKATPHPEIPAPSAEPSGYRYGVELGGGEVGAFLGRMPAAAVPEVFDEFLRTASPEVLGAVVGRLIAHVAARATAPPGGN